MQQSASSSTVPSQPIGRSVALTPRQISAPGAARALLHADARWAPAVARIALAIAILPHGAQKLLGWFGGYGFTGTMQYFTGTMHIPWILAFAAILAETLGGLALLVGFGSRLAASALAVVFAVAAVTVHWQHGFFANWFGNQKGEGVEYFILGIALAAVVIIEGGGRASADRSLTRRIGN
jgi:putative oxidoreductase